MMALRESGTQINLPEELRSPPRDIPVAAPHMRGTRGCGIAFVVWVVRLWSWLGVGGYVCREIRVVNGSFACAKVHTYSVRRYTHTDALKRALECVRFELGLGTGAVLEPLSMSRAIPKSSIPKPQKTQTLKLEPQFANRTGS